MARTAPAGVQHNRVTSFTGFLGKKMTTIKQALFCICLSMMLLLILMLPSGHTWAAGISGERRLALIIGNSDYDSTPLKNPVNDANDMADTLRLLDFDVTLKLDLDAPGMSRAVDEFKQQLAQEKSIGFFYYAGHGVQIDGTNYLIPVNSDIGDEVDVQYKSTPAGSVLAKMQSVNEGLNIIVLDACRNNPFPSTIRSASRGLARKNAPDGSIIIYSTAPGTVAEDGRGRNGTFTEHFMKHLKEPGLSLSTTIRRTRRGVKKATNNRQVPWDSSNLTEDRYILLPKVQKADLKKIEGDAWIEALMVNTPAQIQSFIDRFPKGTYIDAAKLRLDDLTNQGVQVSSLQKVPNLPLTGGDDITNIDPNIVAMIPKKPEKPVFKPGVTIAVTPGDARIRIMNIVDKYKPGMKLPRNNNYDILVQREGYLPWREMVFIDEQTNIVEIKMNKIGEPGLAENKPFNTAEDGWTTIASGDYLMGCSKSDRSCKSAEKPVTPVQVAGFKLAQNEVTVREFKAFVEDTGYETDAEINAGGFTGCWARSEKLGISRETVRWGWLKGKSWKNPGFTQTDEHPVTCVSWNDANAYTKWMTRKLGKTVRLPTEAEWEYAARAGTSQRYSQAASSKDLCTFENVADKTKSKTGSAWPSPVKCTDKYWTTAPVKTFKPNAFGLYDMLGSVSEWSGDVWLDKLPQQPVSRSANTAGDANQRVLRGGSWNGKATDVRVSARKKAPRASRASITGFRVVIEEAVQAQK